MPNHLEYARFAANVYGVSALVRSAQNTIDIPAGWAALNPQANSTAAGFMAKAYKNGNDIVISYAGTTGEGDGIDKARDWLYGNSAGANGFFAARQVVQAAAFYLDVLKTAPDANISFTDHSRKFVDLKFSGRGVSRHHEVNEK
ncbi:MAG: hypothetical protein H7Z39_11890 [Burkholderiaceae bacterium]|nr:hypothetical protein [Burkholderiaceae bacterium]